MHIKFWKKGGGYVLVKDIWHMESCLWHTSIYTEDNREFNLRLIPNDDGTFDGHRAYLVEVKSERDYEHDDWITTVISKTEIQGWMGVHPELGDALE